MFTRFLHRIVSNPWVFDRVQDLFGFEETCQRLRPYLAQIDDQIVLDVGGGTGNFASLVSQSATHLCLDNDPQKLKGFKTKRPSSPAVLGDATQIGLKDKSVDCALCVAIAHHLSEAQFSLLFSELARVTREKLVFLEPVKSEESSLISSLLWKYDRGSNPRSAQTLYSAIEQWFEIEQVEHYAIYHRYILCVGRPRHRI